MEVVKEEQRRVRIRLRTLALRSIGLILFAIALAMVDLRQVAEAVSLVKPAHIVVATFFCLMIVILKGLRWRILLETLKFPQTGRECLKIYSDSIFWGTITPGRIGEFKRIFYLTEAKNASFVRSTSLCLIDRSFDVIAPVFLLVIATSFVPATSDIVPMSYFIGVLLILFVGFLSRRYLMRYVSKAALLLLPSARQYIEEMRSDLLMMSNVQLVSMILLSVVCFLLYIFMVWVLSKGLPFSIGLTATIQCVAMSMLAGFIPISVYNLGTREVVLLSLFSAYGQTSENAISFSFLFILCYVILMFSSFAIAKVLGLRLED